MTQFFCYLKGTMNFGFCFRKNIKDVILGQVHFDGNVSHIQGQTNFKINVNRNQGSNMNMKD